MAVILSGFAITKDPGMSLSGTHDAFTDSERSFIQDALAPVDSGGSREHEPLLTPGPRNVDAARTIKALSIVSPSGSRIAAGQKTLEVRRWAPDLAPDEDLLIVENGRFLHTEGDEDDGLAVAIVRVKAVRPFTVEDIPAACASSYAEGWLAWELTDVRALTEAIPVRAARGIYEIRFPDG